MVSVTERCMTWTCSGFPCALRWNTRSSSVQTGPLRRLLCQSTSPCCVPVRAGEYGYTAVAPEASVPIPVPSSAAVAAFTCSTCVGPVARNTAAPQKPTARALSPSLPGSQTRSGHGRRLRRGPDDAGRLESTYVRRAISWRQEPDARDGRH